jgi:type I site-specific restriction endonuclease
MNKQQAKEIIQQLVEQFKQQSPALNKSEINEHTTRYQFIDKFFEALGWDVTNSNANAPTEQYVHQEQRQQSQEREEQIETQHKYPDYTFYERPGHIKAFFVEAKRPKVDVKNHIDYAYQTRIYGWNEKLFISVLVLLV